MWQFGWYAKRSKPVLSLLYLRPSHDFLSPFKKKLNKYQGSSKMTQWVKATAMQTDSLSSIPAPTSKGMGRTISSDLHTCHTHHLALPSVSPSSGKANRSRPAQPSWSSPRFHTLLFLPVQHECQWRLFCTLSSQPFFPLALTLVCCL